MSEVLGRKELGLSVLHYRGGMMGPVDQDWKPSPAVRTAQSFNTIARIFTSTGPVSHSVSLASSRGHSGLVSLPIKWQLEAATPGCGM